MKRRTSISTDQPPGIYITDVWPIPKVRYGDCEFCSEAISALDRQLVRIVVLSGASYVFHPGCFTVYAAGLTHVRSSVLGRSTDAVD